MYLLFLRPEYSEMITSVGSEKVDGHRFPGYLGGLDPGLPSEQFRNCLGHDSRVSGRPMKRRAGDEYRDGVDPLGASQLRRGGDVAA